jgi:hypothetical protein
MFKPSISKKSVLLALLFTLSIIVAFLFTTRSKIAVSEEVCYMETETGNRFDLTRLCGTNQPSTSNINQQPAASDQEFEQVSMEERLNRGFQQFSIEERAQLRELIRTNPEAARVYVRTIVCRLSSYSEDNCPIDSTQIVFSNDLLQQ